MEKKDREAINKELSEVNDAMEKLVVAKKEAGEARKRMNEYSKQFKLSEIGCSNKETDDDDDDDDVDFENKLKKLKSEHYRTQDCIKSVLDAHGITVGEINQISEGKGEDLVDSCRDDSGENEGEKTQELKKQDDVKKNDSTDSDDVEGLNGGTWKSDD